MEHFFFGFFLVRWLIDWEGPQVKYFLFGRVIKWGDLGYTWYANLRNALGGNKTLHDSLKSHVMNCYRKISIEEALLMINLWIFSHVELKSLH